MKNVLFSFFIVINEFDKLFSKYISYLPRKFIFNLFGERVFLI